MYLTGLHDLENFLAACAAGAYLGADIVAMKDTAKFFKGLPHRMELILEKDGVTASIFVKENDCRATRRRRPSEEACAPPYGPVWGPQSQGGA